MRKTIIAGNWKLNKTIADSLELANGIKRGLAGVEGIEIVICPVFTALAEVKGALTGSNIKAGAQDCYWEDKGAWTGEVSVPLLKDAGAEYVIIGHSERRQFFSETNESVNKKLKAVLKHGLTPIVCVGENLSERESNKTFDVVNNHIKGSFSGISEDDVLKTVVAYEPVWAIGTGKTATPQQAEEVHAYIRKLFAGMYNNDVAESVRLQYGGSVKPDNAGDLISRKDIDGMLVGGASLEVNSFVSVVKNSQGARK